MIEEIELFIIDLEYFAYEHLVFLLILEAVLLVLLGVYTYLNITKKIDEKKTNKKAISIIWGVIEVIALFLIAVGVHKTLTTPRWRVSNCSSAYGCVCEGKETCDCKYTNLDGEEEDIICPNNNIDYTAE